MVAAFAAHGVAPEGASQGRDMGWLIMISRTRRARLASALVLALAALSPAQNADVPAAPVITPSRVTDFVGNVSVTMDYSGNGDKILYTLNGGDPGSSLVKPDQYTGTPIPITETTTLRAVRVAKGQKSAMATGVYTQKQLPEPKAQYGGLLNFAETALCTLTVASPGIPSDIHYTWNGAAPTAADSAYSAPLYLNGTRTLKAAAFHDGYAASTVLSAPFIRVGKVATPAANPPSGSPFDAKTFPVVLTASATPGARFRYTLNPAAKAAAWLATSDTVWLVGNQIGAVTTLKAVAVKSPMIPSDTLTALYTYLPRLSKPVATPAEPDTFYDTVRVRLSADPGAVLHCTYDGKTIPTKDSPICDSVKLLDNTTTIKALAVKAPQQASEVLVAAYTLRLSKPNAKPPTTDFSDSLRILLSSPSPGAHIYYTLDGSKPTTPYDSGGFEITDSTSLRAIAVKSPETSLVAAFEYRKTATPAIPGPYFDPTGKDFHDSERVTLSTQDARDSIYYTFGDTVPDSKSGHLYKAPIPLYRSTRVNAFAYRGGSPASKVGSQNYTLIPSPPTAKPPGGSFPNSVEVLLSTTTRDAEIWFWYGTGGFDEKLSHQYTKDSHPKMFVSDHLKAVTITNADHKMSAEFNGDYTVFPFTESDTLRPGQSRTVEGGYVFTNSSSSPVNAKVASTDDSGIGGFAGLGLGVQLSSAGAALPVITYARKAGYHESLYRLGPDDRVEFVTADSSASLVKPGLYFAAVDTQPPVLKVVGEEVHYGDSTRIRLAVIDNIANPLCLLESASAPGFHALTDQDSSGDYVFKLKGASFAPLWFRARADDFTNKARFPADSGGTYFVQQAWSRFASPAVWNIGISQALPWDFVGVPSDTSTPLTVKKLKLENPGLPLAALIYSDGYIALKDEDRIPAGGFWIGSTRQASSLNFVNVISPSSGADGVFHIRVHPGWNSITNPSWEKLYWPISRGEARYSRRMVKSLYAFRPDSGTFDKTDSLEVWKGYYVHSFLTEDTVVGLLRTPAALPLARAAAPQGGRLELSFGSGVGLPLLLGAETYAQDGVSAEDEPQLPAWKGSAQLWSQRGARRLMTDVLRFDPQKVCKWTLVSDPGEATAGRSSALRLLAGAWPDGFEAWALSPARRVKTRLSQGVELPPGDADVPDTLSIFAGPAAKLAGVPELNGARESIGAPEWSLIPGRDVLLLKATVPQGARLRAELWTAAGRKLTDFDSGELGAGFHAFNLPLSGRSGLGFLRLRISTADGDAHFVRKLVLP